MVERTVDIPPSAVDLIAPGQLPPEDLDPLAEGILMDHQKAWVADHSPLKIAEKGRRTGFTFAEALDSTLIAAAKRSAGGDNTWYIGDTKEKGLEFIQVCARFAKHVAKELLTVEEFLFEDRQDDGSSKFINAYRIRFASGFQIAALSSRPAGIRGLQGRVIIDEAAFHPNVRAVIDACNALLIWGGVIRIVSTHNGALNPFNELLKETREGEGTLLPLAWIEACSSQDFVVKRWAPPAEDFVDWPEAARRAEMRDWLDREVLPILQSLPLVSTHIGEDFAMRRDRTSIAVGYTDQRLVRKVPLIVELQRCPYDQQKQALFFVCDTLPRFNSGILDANGNGMVLAQEARQKYGENRIVELMPRDDWLREHTPKFTAAFEDRTIEIPADRDVRDDLRQFRMVGGVGKIPRDVRTEGTDGGRRHGDSGVALLNFYAATLMDVIAYGYDTPARHRPNVDEQRLEDDDDDDGRFGGYGARVGSFRGAW